MRRLVSATALALAAACGGARAQVPETTAPFRFHGFEAGVSLRGARDEEMSRSARGADPLTQTRPVFEQELSILTHNSVYHPYLLALDLGGGVTFVQESYRSGDQQRSQPTHYWSAIARASLLEQKPYPLNVYYERTRHGVPLGLTERFFTTDTQYGGHFALLQSASPLPLRIDASRQRFEGEGFRQAASEEVGNLSITATRAFDGHGQLGGSYQAHEVRSTSGATLREVMTTHSVTHNADITGSLSLGHRQQFEIESPVSWYRQNEEPHREILRVAPQVRWRPFTSLQLTGRTRTDRVRTTDMLSRTVSTEGELSHQLFESVTTVLHAYSRVNRTGDVRDARGGNDASLAYRKRTPFGAVGFTYARARESLDRQGAPSVVAVYAEPFVLHGLAGHELHEENVVEGSVAVWNELRTRQFVEGVDYRAVVVGVRTRIERLPAGEIADETPLSVDYRYALSGRLSYVADDNSFGVSASVRAALTLSARFRHAPRHLRDGVLGQPLNSADGEVYTAQLNLPWRRLEFESDAELEHHREEIAPFERHSATASLAYALRDDSRLTLTAERVKVDNQLAQRDVNLTALSATLDLRPASSTHLTVSAHDDQDTGSAQPRRMRDLVARAEWAVRRLSFVADLRTAREDQGSYARTRTSLRAELRREFAK